MRELDKNHSNNKDGKTANRARNEPRPPEPKPARADLVTLFRLLLREPPAEHDFRTCPICKRYGIKKI